MLWHEQMTVHAFWLRYSARVYKGLHAGLTSFCRHTCDCCRAFHACGCELIQSLLSFLLVACRYNQAIWASMDPTALGMHLASYSYNGAPLFGQIEPEPVAVTGNLLGFVMRGDEEMSFGGADLPNLWETVAQDLWMVCPVPCFFHPLLYASVLLQGMPLTSWTCLKKLILEAQILAQLCRLARLPACLVLSMSVSETQLAMLPVT